MGKKSLAILKWGFLGPAAGTNATNGAFMGLHVCMPTLGQQQSSWDHACGLALPAWVGSKIRSTRKWHFEIPVSRLCHHRDHCLAPVGDGAFQWGLWLKCYHLFDGNWAHFVPKKGALHTTAQRHKWLRGTSSSTMLVVQCMAQRHKRLCHVGLGGASREYLYLTCDGHSLDS